VTGALEIIFEVVVLIAFQVLYGYVYSKIGMILMGFMVGLTIGGWWMTKRIGGKNVTYGSLLRIQGALCVYPLVLILVFRALSVLSGHTALFLSTEILFPLLIACGGFLGGAQFPLASKLYIERNGRAEHAGGKSYGVDVLGSSLGALVGGSLLIPVLGIISTCIVLSGLSLSALLVLLPGGILSRRAPY
jgi:spermidine synthase